MRGPTGRKQQCQVAYGVYKVCDVALDPPEQVIKPLWTGVQYVALILTEKGGYPLQVFRGGISA